jgi:hypothetical protein
MSDKEKGSLKDFYISKRKSESKLPDLTEEMNDEVVTVVKEYLKMGNIKIVLKEYVKGDKVEKYLEDVQNQLDKYLLERKDQVFKKSKYLDVKSMIDSQMSLDDKIKILKKEVRSNDFDTYMNVFKQLKQYEDQLKKTKFNVKYEIVKNLKNSDNVNDFTKYNLLLHEYLIYKFLQNKRQKNEQNFLSRNESLTKLSDFDREYKVQKNKSDFELFLKYDLEKFKMTIQDKRDKELETEIVPELFDNVEKFLNEKPIKATESIESSTSASKPIESIESIESSTSASKPIESIESSTSTSKPNESIESIESSTSASKPIESSTSKPNESTEHDRVISDSEILLDSGMKKNKNKKANLLSETCSKCGKKVVSMMCIKTLIQIGNNDIQDKHYCSIRCLENDDFDQYNII